MAAYAVIARIERVDPHLAVRDLARDRGSTTIGARRGLRPMAQAVDRRCVRGPEPGPSPSAWSACASCGPRRRSSCSTRTAGADGGQPSADPRRSEPAGIERRRAAPRRRPSIRSAMSGPLAGPVEMPHGPWPAATHRPVDARDRADERPTVDAQRPGADARRPDRRIGDRRDEPRAAAGRSRARGRPASGSSSRNVDPSELAPSAVTRLNAWPGLAVVRRVPGSIAISASSRTWPVGRPA